MTFRLSAYEAKLRVRERKHAKLYWLDSGVVRATKRAFDEVVAEERGSLFEGWVAQLLRAYQLCKDLFEEMYYWSPAQTEAKEVDFLLKRGRDFVAVEAKASIRVREDYLKGLRAIAELKGLRRRIVVYMGPQRIRTQDGIEFLPALEFADTLAMGKLFPSTSKDSMHRTQIR